MNKLKVDTVSSPVKLKTVFSNLTLNTNETLVIEDSNGDVIDDLDNTDYTSGMIAKVVDKNTSEVISESLSYMLGDANNDGYCNAQDQVFLSNYLAKVRTYNSMTKSQILAIDVNEDGNIDEADYQLINDYILKRISTFSFNRFDKFTFAIDAEEWYYSDDWDESDMPNYWADTENKIIHVNSNTKISELITTLSNSHDYRAGFIYYNDNKKVESEITNQYMLHFYDENNNLIYDYYYDVERSKELWEEYTSNYTEEEVASWNRSQLRQHQNAAYTEITTRKNTVLKNGMKLKVSFANNIYEYYIIQIIE